MRRGRDLVLTPRGRAATAHVPYLAQIETELRALCGPVAARNIAYHVAWRYLWDAADLHNTGRRAPVPDAPGEDLPERLPDDLKAIAGTIMLLLCQITRAVGGPACPEMGLPMAYAAEAVILARFAGSPG